MCPRRVAALGMTKLRERRNHRSIKEEDLANIYSISKDPPLLLSYIPRWSSFFYKESPFTLCFKRLVLFKTSDCWQEHSRTPFDCLRGAFSVSPLGLWLCEQHITYHAARRKPVFKTPPLYFLNLPM